MCGGYRDSRLADATSTNDRNKARSGQMNRELEEVIIPADHVVWAAGKVGRKEIDRRVLGTAIPRHRRVALITCPRHRCDEAIASSCDRRDISGAILPIS